MNETIRDRIGCMGIQMAMPGKVNVACHQAGRKAASPVPPGQPQPACLPATGLPSCCLPGPAMCMRRLPLPSCCRPPAACCQACLRLPRLPVPGRQGKARRKAAVLERRVCVKEKHAGRERREDERQEMSSPPRKRECSAEERHVQKGEEDVQRCEEGVKGKGMPAAS